MVVAHSDSGVSSSSAAADDDDAAYGFAHKCDPEPARLEDEQLRTRLYGRRVGLSGSATTGRHDVGIAGGGGGRTAASQQRQPAPRQPAAVTCGLA